MTYIAILLVFLLERYRGIYPRARGDRWFIQMLGVAGSFTSRLRMPVWVEPLLLIGLPCLLIALLEPAVSGILFGLPTLLLLALVLFYSTGRGDFFAALDSYLARWRSGDIQAAYRVARGFSHSEALAESTDIAQLHRHSVEALLYHGFERWFCVVFWFAALGPWAALGYRLARLYIELKAQVASGNIERVTGFIRLLEWLPVRLLALSFALAGNFASSFKAWREQISTGGFSAPVLLRICGIAALGEDEDLACQQTGSADQRQVSIDQGARQMLQLRFLLQRTAVAWLLVMALIILVID